MEQFEPENLTSKKAEKSDLEILNEHLVGKTETAMEKI